MLNHSEGVTIQGGIYIHTYTQYQSYIYSPFKGHGPSYMYVHYYPEYALSPFLSLSVPTTSPPPSHPLLVHPHLCLER